MQFLYLLNKSRYNAFTAPKSSLEKGRLFVGEEWNLWTKQKCYLLLHGFVRSVLMIEWLGFDILLLLLKYVFWTRPGKNLVASLLKYLPFWPLLVKQNEKNFQCLQYFSCFHLSFCFLWIIQVKSSCRRSIICNRIEQNCLFISNGCNWVLSSCQ